MSERRPAGANLHLQQPLRTAGAPLEQARAALILLHGRGATAGDILSLGTEFVPQGTEFVPQGSAANLLSLLAPQAAGGSWYPNRFIAPVAANEPWLTWSLEAVHAVVEQVVAAGLPVERILLGGFSQGACLALEAAARRPQRYGGVVALSGALIEEGDQPRAYSGDLAGTPVFLGCSDVDFHIPLERVQRSKRLLTGLGATVTTRIYPGMGHTVNADEIAAVQAMVAALLVE